jgi:hypothetical protein
VGAAAHHGQALAQRALLILGYAAGKTNTRVAHELRLAEQAMKALGLTILPSVPLRADRVIE